MPMFRISRFANLLSTRKRSLGDITCLLVEVEVVTAGVEESREGFHPLSGTTPPHSQELLNISSEVELVSQYLSFFQGTCNLK